MRKQANDMRKGKVQRLKELAGGKEEETARQHGEHGGYRRSQRTAETWANSKAAEETERAQRSDTTCVYGVRGPDRECRVQDVAVSNLGSGYGV